MQPHGKLSTRLFLVFTSLMVALLAACGKNAGINGFSTIPPTSTVNGTPRSSYDKQIYRFPILGADLDIKSFDPAFTPDLYSAQAIEMVFVGLVRLDDNLQVQPELAQSWEQSADSLQWTFHLRPNLTFSDGTSLTSSDVAYSIDRALQHNLQAPYSLTYLGLIKDSDKLYAGQIKTIIGDSILTPDANTVIIKTNKKAAYFLYALTYPTSYVVEKKLIEEYGNTKFTEHLTEGGGAGPFTVSQYQHKKEIDFVPNPYYYSYKPILQKVVFSFVPDPTTAYQQYQSGQLDFTYVPRTRFNEASQLTKEYYRTPILATSYLAMNFLVKPFDNLYIRQAFALSIQRETINNTIYSGQEIPSYHIIPQGMVGYNLNLTGPAGVKNSKGDFNRARQLLQVGLQQEGWSDVSQVPPIKLTYGKSSTADKVITMLTQMWQSVLGVNVVPDPVTFNTSVTEENQAVNNPKGIQMWFAGWVADYPDPQDWTTLQFDKGSAQNSMNYGQNNSTDALQEQVVQHQLEQADAETNPSNRILLYDSAEQQLINAVAWIPLFQQTEIALLKPYVQGVVLNPLEITPPDDWANVYIGMH